jgi:hypothetical protein
LTDQTAALNTATPIVFGNTDLSVGVYLGSPTSRVYVDRPGVYNDFERYSETRIFFLNVQYRFGQQNNDRKGRGGRQQGMPGGGGMEMMDM